MYLRFLIGFFIATLYGCNTNEILRPTNNITGKIKYIISTYSSGGNKDTISFYYKNDGTLDYFYSSVITAIHSDSVSVALDSFTVNMYNNGYIHTMSKARDVGFSILDSLRFDFNTEGYLESSSDFHGEASPGGNVYIDTSYYQSNNLIKNILGWENFGNTPGSHYWGREICRFTYDYSKISSLTNENIGMPYFGKSSYNAVDSVVIMTYKYNYFNNTKDSFSLKVNNEYDAQGRIVRTNYMPYLGYYSLFRLNESTSFISAIYRNNTYYRVGLSPSYEIAYY